MPRFRVLLSLVVGSCACQSQSSAPILLTTQPTLPASSLRHIEAIGYYGTSTNDWPVLTLTTNTAVLSDITTASMQAARANGTKVFVSTVWIFFETITDDSGNITSFTLRSDYQTQWNNIKSVLAPYAGWIAGFYPADEPFWTAQNFNVSQAQVKLWLETVNSTIKADFPDLPIVLVEAYPMINASLQIPSGYDWIGMDCYGSFDYCGDDIYGYRSIPQYYATLKQKITASQRLVLVGDAYLAMPLAQVTPSDETALAQRATSFVGYVRSDLSFVGLLGFLYDSSAQKTGDRDLPMVKSAYDTFGNDWLALPVSRAEAAQQILSTWNIAPATACDGQVYSDVDSGTLAGESCAYIEKLSQLGYPYRGNDGQFYPSAALTTAQAATLVQAAIQSPGPVPCGDTVLRGAGDALVTRAQLRAVIMACAP